MTDKWPNDKLASQMIFDAEYVAEHYGRSAEIDVACHVKALLTRIRELEENLAIQGQQLNVATTRAQRFRDCLMLLAKNCDLGREGRKTVANALEVSVEELEAMVEEPTA